MDEGRRTLGRAIADGPSRSLQSPGAPLSTARYGTNTVWVPVAVLVPHALVATKWKV